MNRYPAKPMMDEMARHGRYGDSMLVHMHPAEVAGLASLVPGGRLTTNPVTGQPEAFLPLLFGALGGALKLGTLGTAALTGVGTAAVTGDVKRGLLAGLTAGAASGIGETLAGVKEGVDAAQLATETAQTATQAADTVQAAVDSGGDIMSAIGAGGAGATPVPPVGIEQALAENIDAAALQGKVSDFSMSQIGAPEAQGLGSAMVPSTQPQNFSQKIFGGAEDVVNKGLGSLGTTGQLAIAGVGQGSIEQMKMEEQMRRQAEGLRAEGEADRREAYDDLQRGYAMAQPGIPTGLSDARSEMSRRTPPPIYAAGGGQIRRMAEGGNTEENTNPYDNATRFGGLGVARDVARFMGGPRGYGGIDPVEVQQRQRGQDVIAPPKDYMPGFEPEFNYFQNLTRDPDGNIVGTPDVPDRGYRPMRQGVISRSQYFDPVLQSPQSNAQMNEYRRTLEKLDPGPLDEASVMGLASEGSTLSTAQQNMFEQYAPLAPFNMSQRDRLSELTDRGMSLSEAIANQEQTRAKGYDLDGDGVVTDAEFTGATTEPATPDVPDSVKGLDPEVQARIQEYLDTVDPETAKFLSSLGYLGGLSFNFAQGGQIPEKMPEVGPAPAPQVGPPPTGGDIPIRTSMMESTVPDGGIARVPTEFTEASEQQKRLNKMTGLPFGEEGEDVRRDVQALEAAVLGKVDEGLSEQITAMFIQKYGSDVFQLARDTILRGVVPNAQTEGMISGPGGGMDDMVQGMIGSEQPVAVSPGEFIVPADVVSGIGDGSSDAGAKKLDTMMERVRVERNGTTKQAPRINERKVMPA
jgi:hypothetical protein